MIVAELAFGQVRLDSSPVHATASLMSSDSRRAFLESSLLGLSALGWPQTSSPEAVSRRRIVCVGAHPDDPESGCGGTLARYAAAGHHVTIVYLTRGERGIDGKTLDQAAAIRTGEARQACAILGATPVFGGQIDGDTVLNGAEVRRFAALLSEHQPDVVFAHWPVDTHLDHQIASVLAFRAWLEARQAFALWYFEVNAGEQTRLFKPTDYVDITPVREVKKRALFAHVSQDGPGIYRDHHGPMEAFRGREIGVAAAEAFVRAARPELP
jgi:LmbE family N-acetylglucosaminyl deacetylase